MFSPFYTSFFGFREPARESEFRDWIQPERQRQIAASAALTGLLYLLNAAINYFVAAPELYTRMVIVRVVVVPPLLLFIAVLGLRTHSYRWVARLMILSPMVAAAASFYVFAGATDLSLHLNELYMMLLWIFVVTGLTLSQALFSALPTFAILLFGTFAYLNLSTAELVYHLFWSLCAFSFGVFGGALIERSSRERFEAHKDLERLAVTDELTGLFNRVRLRELLHSELDRSRRYHRPFGVMVLDVDHFKEVNDEHGHHTGDQLLVELAAVLKSSSRATDSLFRWGGEEFVIVSPETDEAGLRAQAEKLRRKVEEFAFSSVGRKSISVGVTRNLAEDTPETLLMRADKAVYRAKSEGRNQVIYQE